MHGVTTRLPRVAHEPIRYKEWLIPPDVRDPDRRFIMSNLLIYFILIKTPVSHCNYFVHMDPAIFPDPFEFKPERWIEAQEQGVRLEQHLVSFGRGSRRCVGIK